MTKLEGNILSLLLEKGATVIQCGETMKTRVFQELFGAPSVPESS